MSHPFQVLLDPEAVAALARARLLRQPAWFVGGPGAGAHAIARSLHRDGDPWGFVSVRVPLSPAEEIERRLGAALDASPHLDLVSLYVERVDRQLLSVQEQLLRLLDEGLRLQNRAVPLRLLVQSDTLPGAGDLLVPLRQRLSALVIRLPTLAERRGDIPALARELVLRIASELGVPAPLLSESAVSALVERDWPGNVEELHAVLTGAVASGKTEVVDDDVAGVPRPEFAAAAANPGPVQLTRPLEAPAARSTSRSAAKAGTDARDLKPHSLEILLAELAHELKNPMVTIKTFAEQFDRLAKDDALREKFVRLTTEAIERMDRSIEQLLAFSRFGDPRARRISLRHLVYRAVSGGESTVRDRVRTNGIPAELIVQGDEDQLVFALHSVARCLLQALPGDGTLTVDCTPGGDVVFRGWAKGVGNKLHAVLGEGAVQGLESSLDFVMAEALVRRNGGSSRVVRGSKGLEVSLQLPPGEGA